jgi:autophagy-related protein 101
LLAEKILFIAESMNRSTYVPKMPNQPELELIFDTSFIDIQPYLFEVSFPLLFFLRPPNETCP